MPCLFLKTHLTSGDNVFAMAISILGSREKCRSLLAFKPRCGKDQGSSVRHSGLIG